MIRWGEPSKEGSPVIKGRALLTDSESGPETGEDSMVKRVLNCSSR